MSINPGDSECKLGHQLFGLPSERLDALPAESLARVLVARFGHSGTSLVWISSLVHSTCLLKDNLPMPACGL